MKKIKKIWRCVNQPLSLSRAISGVDYVEYKVTVLSIVGRYAMIRRSRAMPFVVDIKELFDEKLKGE